MYPRYDYKPMILDNPTDTDSLASPEVTAFTVIPLEEDPRFHALVGERGYELK